MSVLARDTQQSIGDTRRPIGDSPTARFHNICRRTHLSGGRAALFHGDHRRILWSDFRSRSMRADGEPLKTRENAQRYGASGGTAFRRRRSEDHGPFHGDARAMEEPEKGNSFPEIESQRRPLSTG